MLLTTFSVIILSAQVAAGGDVRGEPNANLTGDAIAANAGERLRRAAIQGPIKLIDEKHCPEIRRWCSHLKDGDDDLSVLECVQTFLSSQVESLSDECQHAIWSHTSELIGDASVLQLTQSACSVARKAFNWDADVGRNIGNVLAKMVDAKEQIKQGACVALVERLEAVAFADFRLVGPFVRQCAQDIDAHACGRFHADRSVLSQGDTLACLQSHIEQLSLECQSGIAHLSELQADNVRLDRPLFLACKGDVAAFCAESRPAEIYKCLLLHKGDEKMSRGCQEQLSRRAKVITHDYKVSKGLARSCKEDIKINHCRRGVSEDKDVRLAQILLCLEAAHKNSTRIASECLAEIADHRRMLLQDYKMSPEILSDCVDDISKFCNDVEAGGGRTIHCLMENARPKRKKDRRVTARCQRALEMLVKVSDVGEDWRVDPVLRNACKPVVDASCSNVDGGNARVMDCLMNKVGTQLMRPDCEAALMQIQYFVARDFKLEPQLYRSCRDDAVRLCHAKRTWADLDAAQMDPERGPMVLPCLYRYAYHPDQTLQLRPDCLREVKATMHRRAVSVDLIPEVEDECIDDLAALCFEKTAKGEEMQCLQDNLAKLHESCRVSIRGEPFPGRNLTSLSPAESGRRVHRERGQRHRAEPDHNDVLPRGDGAILRQSEPRERRHDRVSDLAQERPRAAAGSQMPRGARTLPDHLAAELPLHVQVQGGLPAVRAEVLPDEQHQERRGRVPQASPLPPHPPRARLLLIPNSLSAPSEVIRNDTLRDQRHTIPKECRQQIRTQLFQQRENIDFDPKLKTACRKEIKEICPKAAHGGAQVNTKNASRVAPYRLN